MALGEPANRTDVPAPIRLRRWRCHNVVTTRCELGEPAGDGLRWFRLVSPAAEAIVAQSNSAHVRLGVKAVKCNVYLAM
jgi:hypothetical protein